MKSIPPLGVPIDTLSGSGGVVQIDGQSYGAGALRLVLVNRLSLEVRPFSFADTASGIGSLRAKIDEFDDNWLDIVTAPIGLKVSSAEATVFNDKVVKQIGGAPLDPTRLAAADPFSIVGVRGWESGTGYENLGHLTLPAQEGDTRAGALIGYLQRSPESEALGFVFPDFPTVNTNAFPEGQEPNGNLMVVDGKRYFQKLPAGQSGFHVLTLDRYTLKERHNLAFTTNGGGSGDEGWQANLGSYLKDQVLPSEIVLIQSIGSPRPTTAGWNSIADGMTRLGGLRTVVNALKDDSRYALVGGPAIKDSAVESVSDSATLQNGSISGVLARDHGASFAPLLSDPTSRISSSKPSNLGLSPKAATGTVDRRCLPQRSARQASPVGGVCVAARGGSLEQRAKR